MMVNVQTTNSENSKQNESIPSRKIQETLQLDLQKSLTDELKMIGSTEDIRKIYKFNPKPIGHGHFGTVRFI